MPMVRAGEVDFVRALLGSPEACWDGPFRPANFMKNRSLTVAVPLRRARLRSEPRLLGSDLGTGLSTLSPYGWMEGGRRTPVPYFSMVRVFMLYTSPGERT